MGEVTDLAETMIPKKDRQVWHYEVEYQFPLPDGRLMSATRQETRTDRRTDGTADTGPPDPAPPGGGCATSISNEHGQARQDQTGGDADE